MLDLDCDIAANLETLKKENMDILAGYYRNVTAADAVNYQADNWLGFIHESKTEDFCSIYSDVFPEFIQCDIVENFYIGVTEKVKKVGYPEDIPIKEHNLVFLRFKHAGLKVGMTSRLFVRHFHIKNKKKDYNKYRNREVVNPIDKTVYGILVQRHKVFKFDNYLDMTKVRFVEKKKFAKNLLLKIKSWLQK